MAAIAFHPSTLYAMPAPLLAPKHSTQTVREQYSPSSSEKKLWLQSEQPTYQHLVLPNGLKVLLISDSTIEKSAAALSVGVGSLMNPDQHPGLAHFLEHMLFLGTEKYPEVGRYQRYMTENGGYSNAYTADETTNYHFMVNHTAFEEGLSRLSQFFISPTLDETYIQRELNAVDAEHGKNLKSDSWRIHQVMRNLFNPAHPLARFATGNSKTLAQANREVLLTFYEQYYAPHKMTLALVSNAPIAQMTAWAETYFSKVPKREGTAEVVPQNYLSAERAFRMTWVQSVADIKQLRLHFPLPSMHASKAQKPLQLLSSILGHEGEGSLLSLLKADGLATALSAGASDNSKHYSSFEINIELTKAGLAQYEQVLTKTFGSIASLRAQGLTKPFYQEAKQMAALNFMNRGQRAAIHQATMFASLMHQYPVETLPDAAFLIKDYAPQLYQQILDLLIPDRALGLVISQKPHTSWKENTSFSLAEKKTEPHYGTAYRVWNVRDDLYKKLSTPLVDARWQFPQKNPFIPHKLVLRDPKGALHFTYTSYMELQRNQLPQAILENLQPLIGKTFHSLSAFYQKAALSEQDSQQHGKLLLRAMHAVPSLMMQEDRITLWHVEDWRIRQPKAAITLRFSIAKNLLNSAKSIALKRLYIETLEESLNSFSYPIHLAGLSYGWSSLKEGLQLRIAGYSQKLPDLLEVLLKHASQPEFSTEQFQLAKERLTSGLQNQALEQPYHQLRYYRNLQLFTPSYTREEVLSALDSLTEADIRTFASAYWKKIYIEGVSSGNVNISDVTKRLRSTLDERQVKPLSKQQRMETKVKDLSKMELQQVSYPLAIDNSLGARYQLFDEGTSTFRAAIRIIEKALSHQFYYQLRTEQQLGYIVHAGTGSIKKTLFFAFLVQSNKYSAAELLQRIEAFLPTFATYFANLTESEFKQLQKTAALSLLQREDSMSDLADRVFWLAFERDGEFDRRSEEIKAAEGISKSEVLAILNTHLTKSPTVLNIQLQGTQEQ